MKFLWKLVPWRTTRPIAVRLVPVLLIAGGMVALATWGSRWWVVDSMANSLAADDDATAARRIRELGKLGISAVEPLVQAASSPRTSVALAAQTEIDNLLDTWTVQQATNPNASETYAKAELLAESLARHAEEFDEVADPWLQRVAADLLLLAEGTSAGNWPKITDYCQQIISNTEPLGTAGSGRAVSNWPAQLPIVDTPALATSNNWLPAPLVVDSITSDESLGTGWRPSPQYAQPPQASPAPLSATPPESFGPPAVANVPPPTAPGPFPMVSQNIRPMPIAEIETQSDNSADVRQLLEQLAEGDEMQADRAAIELAKRGYGNATQRDAQMLLSNSVDDRVSLVDRVSTSRKLAASPWLKLLVADGAGEVRAAAVGAMTVSNDTELRELAWQTALNDSDPRVARWIAELQKTR